MDHFEARLPRCARGGASFSKLAGARQEKLSQRRERQRAAGDPASLTCRNGLAGAEGIEPSNAGIKIQCLTTWRRPSRSGTPITRPAGRRKPGKLPSRQGLRGRLRGVGRIAIRALPQPEPVRNRLVSAAYRRVAQPGRALRSGRRGRRFESSLSDQFFSMIFANTQRALCQSRSGSPTCRKRTNSIAGGTSDSAL